MMVDESNNIPRRNKGWDNLKPARKGEPSRNPNGRPKKVECITTLLKEELEKHPIIDGEEAKQSWKQLIVAAWLRKALTHPVYFKELIERVEGRVIERVEVAGRGGGVFKIEYVSEKGDGDKG